METLEINCDKGLARGKENRNLNIGAWNTKLENGKVTEIYKTKALGR